MTPEEITKGYGTPRQVKWRGLTLTVAVDAANQPNGVFDWDGRQVPYETALAVVNETRDQWAAPLAQPLAALATLVDDFLPPA